MQGKNSWGINFCANTRSGACIRTRANTGKYFGGAIFLIFPIFEGEFISVQVHAAPVFAPARIQENTPGELFIGFVPGGNSLRWWQKITTVVKHYGRVSETPCFLGENSQEISTDNELIRR